LSASTLLSAFAVLFLAELGDKTQLIAMSLAHRHRPAPVLAGILAAFAVLNLLAVVVGAALYELVPERAVLITAGVLFLGFGWHLWRAGAEEEEAAADTARSGWGVALASFGLIFVAEMGDKTQIALVAMAAATGRPVATLIGATAALWAVSILGVAVGATLLRRLPALWVHRGAALLFAAFGVWAFGRAAGLA
jgi:putative Ca2+/H+ antiporter (TMEM165/GDT1 family)